MGLETVSLSIVRSESVKDILSFRDSCHREMSNLLALRKLALKDTYHQRRPRLSVLFRDTGHRRMLRNTSRALMQGILNGSDNVHRHQITHVATVVVKPES